MTNREFFTNVMNGIITDAEKAHAEAEIAKLDKRNENRSSKPNKKQLENEPIKAEIVALLKDKGAMIASEIGLALSTEERPISTNKAVALCNQLVKEEKLVAEDVKIPKVGLRKQYACVALAPASED